MKLIDYHEVAVSEGRHPHKNGMAEYEFVSPSRDLMLVVRVMTQSRESAPFPTCIELYTLDGRLPRGNFSVILEQTSEPLVSIVDGKTDKMLPDVRSFAEYEFVLRDDASGKNVPMEPRRQTIIEKLGFVVRHHLTA